MENKTEKNKNETTAHLEFANERLMIDSNVREKMDGRMVASWGRNLALNKPEIHFYPEDRKKLEELYENGDEKGVVRLKKELIAQGRYYQNPK